MRLCPLPTDVQNKRGQTGYHALGCPTTTSAATDGSTGRRAPIFTSVPAKGAAVPPLKICQRSASPDSGSFASFKLGDGGIVRARISRTQDFFAGATAVYFWSRLASRGVAHPSRCMRVGRSGGGRWEQIEGGPLVSLRSPLTAEACRVAPFWPIPTKKGEQRAPPGVRVLAGERTNNQRRYRETKSQCPWLVIKALLL